jgi:hypothetical protein
MHTSWRCGKGCQWVYETAETRCVLVDALRPTMRVRPEGHVSISLSNIGLLGGTSDDAFNGALSYLLNQRMSSAKPALEKNGILRAKNMATTRSKKDDEESKQKRVLSDKLSQITRSARVLQSPSCLGDGRLEGLSIWRREETSMRAGGWPKSPSLCKMRALGSQWLLALCGPCDQQPRLDNGWRCRRRGWLHPGAVTRARRA